MFNIDPQRPLSLYVHIPFCEKKCSYCAFYSLASCPKTLIDSFSSKLLSEINELSSWYGKPFYTVFFGGGNPGLLGPENLLSLCKACCLKGKPKEFTIEINPETLGPWIAPCFEFVTRLSVGIQSFNPSALRILGRNCSLKQTLEGLTLSQKLREKYKFSLNYDLICCVPGALEASQNDIQTLFKEAKFEHLSLYALSLEKGTALEKEAKEGLFALPSDDEQALLLLKLWKKLKDFGMEHYEVSNFAFKGHECLHNLVYWRMGQYFGLGPGAASTIFAPYGRIECKKDLASYVKTPIWTGYEKEDLNLFQQFEEWAIMGLRTKYGLSSEECKSRFGFGLEGLSYPGYGFRKGAFAPKEKGFLLADGAARHLISLALEKRKQGLFKSAC